MNAEVNTALDISEIISTTQPSKRAHGSKVERLNEGWKEKKVEELKREGVWGGRARRRVANEHHGFARLAQCHPLSAGAKEGV